MAAEIAIPWGVYLELGELAYDLAAQIFGLPDPLDLFIGLFNGRPTLQATADIAGLLNKYTSPTIKFLALGAGASLNAGVPLSASSGDPIFGPFYGAALGAENAIRWGSQNQQATNLDNVTLTNALHEGGNPGVAGTATLDAIQRTWELLAAGKPQPGDAAYIAITQLSKDAGLDPTSRMLAGFSQAAIAAGLIPGAQPPAPTPATPATPAPVRPPTTSVDQCCIELAGIQYQGVEMLAGLAGITYQIVEQIAGLGAPAASTVAELNGIRRQLLHIWRKMPPSTAAEQTVFALECICDAINNFQASTGGSIDLNPIVQALNNLTDQAQAIANNLTGLTANYPELDAITKQLVDYMAQNEYIDATVAQTLSS